MLSHLQSKLLKRSTRQGPAWGYNNWPDARHVEPSFLCSADDLFPRPTPHLIDLLIRAAAQAINEDLHLAQSRCEHHEDRVFLNTWPGEHYKLLSALGKVLGAQHAVEIGTFRGLGTLALASSVPHVTTYDVIPVSGIPSSYNLGPSGHDDPAINIEQRVGDLSDPKFFASQRDVLRSADLVFVDGPKDGRFEPRFAELLYGLIQDQNTIVIWDDIRLLVMIDFWRKLPVAKLDATTFGHWSGTGLTESS